MVDFFEEGNISDVLFQFKFAVYYIGKAKIFYKHQIWKFRLPLKHSNGLTQEIYEVHMMRASQLLEC